MPAAISGKHAGPRLSTALGALLFATLVFAALAWANRGLLAAELHEVEDLAANSILVQEAKALRQRTGNYSRLGFYHPGPAFLYVLAAGEGLVHDALGWAGSPISGQLAAVLVMNSLWIGALFWLLSRLAGSASRAALATTLFVLAAAWRNPQFLGGLWFPYLYFLPFAVFTAALARLSSGHLRECWLLVLAAGFLVHGHAAFIAIVGLMTALGLASFAVVRRTTWRLETRSSRGALVASGAVGAVFALPIALDFVLRFPGELPSYFFYGRSVAPNTWSAVLGYVAAHWGVHLYATAALGLAALVAFRHDRPLARAAGVMVASAAATIALILYARTGIDHLAFLYAGLFYFAVPALVVGLLGAALVERFGRAGSAAMAVSLGIVAFVLMKPAQIRNEPEVAKVAAALHAQPFTLLDLEWGSDSDWVTLWTAMAGVTAEVARGAQRPYCIRHNWHVLFSRGFRCSEEQVARSPRQLVRLDRGAVSAIRGAGLSFQSSGVPVLRTGETAAVNVANAVFTSGALGNGWYAPERDFTWTVGSRARLSLRLEGTADQRLVFDTQAFLPRPPDTQSVSVYVNGQRLEDWRFSQTQNHGLRLLDVPATARRPDGMLVILFEIAEPRSPFAAGISGDRRALGMALRSVQLQPR